MFRWRNALILGLGFVIVGTAYFLLQGGGVGLDRAGATLLILLGFSMAFVFMVLLRGSREL
jgi:hypothetical protein